MSNIYLFSPFQHHPWVATFSRDVLGGNIWSPVGWPPFGISGRFLLSVFCSPTPAVHSDRFSARKTLSATGAYKDQAIQTSSAQLWHSLMCFDDLSRETCPSRRSEVDGGKREQFVRLRWFSALGPHGSSFPRAKVPAMRWPTHINWPKTPLGFG